MEQLISRVRRTLLVPFLVLSCFVCAQEAEAWMQYGAGWAIWREEPGDNCGAFESMCAYHCGGGSYSFDCEYVYVIDWTNADCYCA
jgi:hypothetical protein